MRRGLTMTALAMALTAGTAGAGAAAGRPAADDAPRALAPLFACLGHADDGVRLSCLEAETRRLQTAEQRRDVVVMDRQQATALRQAAVDRPARPGRVAQPAFAAFDTLLTAANRNGDRWTFGTNGDGAWIQADAVELGRTPRVGDRLRVRRGAVGGFLANVGDGPAFRVRRLR